MTIMFREGAEEIYIADAKAEMLIGRSEPRINKTEISATIRQKHLVIEVIMKNFRIVERDFVV